MAAARVLFALVASLQGYRTLATFAVDQPDANCVPMGECTSAVTTDDERGLCVAAGDAGTSTNMCWDACNTAHDELSYVGNAIPANFAYQRGVALMVKQFRTGQRGQNSCENVLATSVCNPGERCTPPGLTWGRGMCTYKAGAGNECLDMCSLTTPESAFKAPGKEAGTIATVRAVRANRDPRGLTTCPGPSVWYWLWIPILLCCCIGFCAIAYYAYTYYRQRLKKYRGGNDSHHAYVGGDMPEEPFVDYNQVEPQPTPTYTIEEPAPIYEEPPQLQPVSAAPEPAPLTGNIFGEPNLLRTPSAVPQPQTVVQPMGAYGGFPTVVSQPAGTSFQPMYGGSMATGMPQYSAYGAYGQTGAVGGFPTNSMRIG